MRTLDIIIAWLLIAFGVVHITLTRTVHPTLDLNAIWFVCGGLLLIAIGALNLLRVAYSAIANGVRIVSVIANIVLLLLMLFMASLLPMRSNPQLLAVLIVAVLLLVFSVGRRDGRVQARTQGAK